MLLAVIRLETLFIDANSFNENLHLRISGKYFVFIVILRSRNGGGVMIANNP